MRPLAFLFLICVLGQPLRADGISPSDLVEAALSVMESEAEHGDNEEPGTGSADNPIVPEFNTADVLATECFSDEDCHACMTEAIQVSNDAYEALAKNHAWKKWADTEYQRMDALASAAAGLNKYSKMAYSLQKSRVIIPAKKSFEDNVKTAQTTTLNSLRSAFEKIGRCEAEFLGQDNFTVLALTTWQILKVKYLD